MAVVALLMPQAPAAPAAMAAVAAPAKVDPSFGGGFATHSFSALDDEAQAVAVQADGAVVVVGLTNTQPHWPPTPPDIFVARFTPSGALDPSFSTDGVAVIGAAGQHDVAYAVAVQEDRRIVIGGAVNDRPSVLRLTSTGTLDTEFQGGVVPVVDWNQHVTAVALQADGKIVFTGSTLVAGRLNPDGTFDSTFGVGGRALISASPMAAHRVIFQTLALQADGKIVLGGSTIGQTEAAVLARYTASGQPDATFGDGGLVAAHRTIDFARRATKIVDVAVQPDGRIVAVGDVSGGASVPMHMGTMDVLLFRFLPDGRPDPAFSADGVSISRFTRRTIPSQGGFGVVGVPESHAKATAVSLDADGSILVVGVTFERTWLPLVMRYTSGGLPDPTFGQEGALVVDMGAGRWGTPSAVAIQPDGRLVVVGSTRAGNIEPGIYYDMMIGRVIPGTGSGTVWTWGWNAFGQAGDGTILDRPSPVQVPGLTGVVAVSGGAYHTLALRGDGTVWSWGMNVYGQLGDGTVVERRRPVRVPGLSGVVAVAAGGLHSLALRGDGTVWSWGWNGYGQLGDGTTSTRLAPVPVTAVQGIAAISAGLYHNFAIREEGTALGWGFNGVGQLGDGTNLDKRSPVWIPVMPVAYAYHQLSAGGLHSLSVQANAQFGATGWNGVFQVNGRAGDTNAFGAPLSGGAHMASAGWYHSLLLHTNGSVLSAGWNGNGQLGDGTTLTHGWNTVPGLTGIRSVSAGGMHSLALTDDGHVKAWGWNGVGQLGLGTTVDARSPATVASLTNVATISAGFLHAVVIRG